MTQPASERLPLIAVQVPEEDTPPGRLHIPPRLLGVVLVIGSAFLYSVLSLLIKVASFDMPSMETVFWRSIVAWSLNLVAIRVYRVDVRVSQQFWKPLVVRCVIGTAAMSLSFYAIQQMVLADASVLLFTSPIWTFFLGAIIVSERIDKVHFAFALLSFVGVICVARPTFIFGKDPEQTKTSSTFAIACALLSAFSRSMVYVSMRQLQQLNFMVVIHYYLLTTTVFSAVSLFVVERNFKVEMRLSAWAAVIGAGLVGFFSQLLLTRGFQLEKAGIASVMRNLDVVFAFIWDLTLLHEPISVWSVVGAVVICTCAAMIARRRLKHN